MKKFIVSSLGIILATGAVSAFAGKKDQENLAQCKADVKAHYGEQTRMRLRSIKRGEEETHMRLMVSAPEGNTLVVCSVDAAGASSLADRDGVALVTNTDEQRVSLAQ